MKQIILVFAMALAWAFPMKADETRDGVRAVISAQFEAFANGDYLEAFGLASPGIRNIFRDADRFGAMVENGYPMVSNPDETRFLELSDEPGGLTQRVLVRDAGGTWHTLDYSMVQVEENWRVDGVELITPAEA